MYSYDLLSLPSCVDTILHWVTLRQGCCCFFPGVSSKGWTCHNVTFLETTYHLQWPLVIFYKYDVFWLNISSSKKDNKSLLTLPACFLSGELFKVGNSGKGCRALFKASNIFQLMGHSYLFSWDTGIQEFKPFPLPQAPVPGVFICFSSLIHGPLGFMENSYYKGDYSKWGIIQYVVFWIQGVNKTDELLNAVAYSVWKSYSSMSVIQIRGVVPCGNYLRQEMCMVGANEGETWDVVSGQIRIFQFNGT